MFITKNKYEGQIKITLSQVTVNIIAFQKSFQWLQNYCTNSSTLRAFKISVAGRTTSLSAPQNTIQSQFSCFAGFDKQTLKQICKTIYKIRELQSYFSIPNYNAELEMRRLSTLIFTELNYLSDEKSLVTAKVNWVITSISNTTAQ